MMLIDLDKVVSICDEDNNNIVIFGNIKDAEVKAIPTEWIEKYIWSADTHEEKRALRKMYIQWEKENETDTN